MNKGRSRFRSRDRGGNAVIPVLLDHFNDTNGTLITAHTPDIGSAATGFTGTEPQIQSGAMTAMAAAANRALWDVGIANKEIIIHSSVNASQIFPMFRFIDNSNRYYVTRSIGGAFSLIEVDTSVTTVRDSDSTPYVAGETIKIVDDGNTITVTLTSNGVDTVLSYATTLFNTETNIAVQLNDATTSIDYISVRAL